MIPEPKFWKQWSVVVFVLAAIAVIVFLGFPQLHEAYVVEMMGPQFQRQLGFKTIWGEQKFERGPVFYISEVAKEGTFEKAGVKPGFIPFGYMHGSEIGFYSHLAGARGEKTTLRFFETSPNGESRIHTIEIEVPK